MYVRPKPNRIILRLDTRRSLMTCASASAGKHSTNVIVNLLRFFFVRLVRYDYMNKFVYVFARRLDETV